MMFTPVFYGRRPLLDAGNYYNLLYQEGIRPELLDFIGHNYNFHPAVLVRALHEGEPIDRVNREVDWNLYVSREKAREIGDIYLLVFAAVALREYERLDHDLGMAYLDEVKTFLESLQQDGYTYRGGHIYSLGGTVVAPIPLNGTTGIPDTPKPQAPEPPPPAGIVESRADSPAQPMEKRPATEANPAKKAWSRNDWIGFWSLVAVTILGIATIIATIASPEVRRFFGLDKPSPVASERNSPNAALQPNTNQNASTEKGTAPPQPSLPTGPGDSVGMRANATVVVHRATPESGADTAVVATTGNGEQEIKLGAAPTKLMFTPPNVAIGKRDLPTNIEINGQQLTVVRYTNSGFVIDDHKHWDVHFTVYMLEGEPAKKHP